MPSPPDRRRRRWHLLATAGIGFAALCVGAPASPVGAQDGPSASQLIGQFGGYAASASGSAVQLSYNAQNVLPLPAPLLQVSLPEAQTSLATGPSALALGSLAFPGNLLASLPQLVGQAAPDAAGFVPPYPILVKAEYPSGPAGAEQSIATAQSAVTVGPTSADAVLALAAIDVPGILHVGGITSASRSAIVDGAIEARLRVELSDVDLLFGLVHIDALVTDIVASSSAVDAASAGGTTVVGASLLGLPITIGPDGIVVDEPRAPDNPGPLAPLFDNLPDLGPLSDGLNQVVAPVNDLLTQVLGTATGTLNDLLDAAGISIRVLDPVESLAAGAATRTANGLVIDVEYDGRGDNPLAQLLALIPPEALPPDPLVPGLPVNTSPQALVNLLRETHVAGFAIAYGSVSAQATEAFTFTPPPPSAPPTAAPVLPPSIDVPFTPPASPGFTTPAPVLSGSTPSTGDGTVPASSSAPAGAVGIGALVALVVLVASPTFAFGSTKLADNVLAAAAAGCPEGR